METTSLLGNSSSSNENQHNGGTQSFFSGVGSLISLLPTSTVFLFQFVNPIATNYGHCTRLHKYLSAALLIVCSLSCIFASFTDSYIGSDGRRYYGIATFKGLWPAPPSESVDLSAYRLRGFDLVYALLSLCVFAMLGFLDMNTVRCLYPVVGAYVEVLLNVSLPIMGLISGMAFLIFPWRRNGVGTILSTNSVR